MDWIEQLKEIAYDPMRAVRRYADGDVKEPNGKPYRPTANPPASLEEIETVEREIEMKLPEDLRRVYLEVGNGGFGPGCGLDFLMCTDQFLNPFRNRLEKQEHIGLNALKKSFPNEDHSNRPSAVEQRVKRFQSYSGILGGYRLMQEAGARDYGREWPEHFIPICTGGCDHLGAIDLATGRVGFLQYELFEAFDDIKAAPFEKFTEWKASSVQDWFTKWIQGEQVMWYSEKFWYENLNPLFEIWTGYGDWYEIEV